MNIQYFVMYIQDIAQDIEPKKTLNIHHKILHIITRYFTYITRYCNVVHALPHREMIKHWQGERISGFMFPSPCLPVPCSTPLRYLTVYLGIGDMNSY